MVWTYQLLRFLACYYFQKYQFYPNFFSQFYRFYRFYHFKVKLSVFISYLLNFKAINFAKHPFLCFFKDSMKHLFIFSLAINSMIYFSVIIFHQLKLSIRYSVSIVQEPVSFTNFNRWFSQLFNLFIAFSHYYF